MEDLQQGEIIIYETSDGQAQLDVRLENETLWLSQRGMAELFAVDVRTISYHLKEIFKSAELKEESVIQKNWITATDGKNYLTNTYNLDAIISVGYRVNSYRATQFRIWATQVLKEYIVKGFALDDERLKGRAGGDYWKELLDRIRDIRTDERLIYRQVLDLYATSYDYKADAEETRTFFAAYQNKFHFAIHQHTAGELICERADANQPFMGLRSFKGYRPTKAEVRVAKNYMEKNELDAMKSLVSGFFDFAEMQAKLHNRMYMKDYLALLDDLIRVNKRPILEGKGKVSYEQAKQYAEKQYNLYINRTLSSAEEDYMKTIREIEHAAKNRLKNGK
ncbi:MAG: RhuM family protein [Paludibacteraceae bacterium]|nr:RhuM family protein [Paludibacteraceae bacterium]